MEATFDIKQYNHPKGKLVDLVDQVEAKTKQADLLRSRAYTLAVPGIYMRMCGNRDRASKVLLKVARCIE